ncbi:MAG: DUF1549 and DUF1553 domain-containing protein [Pirellulales bacterium]
MAVVACRQSPAIAAEPVSFDRDVMAVLSKAGCNQGACHGNFHGKGGFKLSLRGQHPDEDFATLSRDQLGRRTNVLDPDDSLILLKPTMAIGHEGGRRFDRQSPEYAILREWIVAGMNRSPEDEPRLVLLEVSPRDVVLIEPQDSVPLAALAVFADGQRRDVRRLACYDPSSGVASVSADGVIRRQQFGDVTVVVRYLDRQAAVRVSFVPQQTDFVWRPQPARTQFDVDVFSQLESLRQNPAPAADDATFVRRAMLDLLGILPTADEAREFVADLSPDKRERLVDALLARPEFADRFALKWADLLRGEEKQLDARGVAVYHTWIRDSIARGKPLDAFVRELVTADGSTYENPPANFYRALRDPIQRGEATAQVFLGTRLQCAKCHNHPFERWTQDDYYRWAAVFARIDYKIIKNDRRDELDKHEFNGEQIVRFVDTGDVEYPRNVGDGSGKALPKFLGGDDPGDRFADADGKNRTAALADWLARDDNRLFVNVQANRIWRQVMGVGIVEPVDDFRSSNPPSNPALLASVARELVAGGFDLRTLVRRIANSHVYQAAAVFDEAAHPHVGDEHHFARAAVVRLEAEQLLDAIHQTLDVPQQWPDVPLGTRSGQLPGVASVAKKRGRGAADDFLKTFGKPSRQLVCECERSDETTLAQTFAMVSGEVLNDALADKGNRLARWAAGDTPIPAVIDRWYWTALGRPPTAEEQQACHTMLFTSEDRLTALQDIAWAVLNAKEFVFRH